MDLALNNLQRLICHKTNKPTNQPGCLINLIVVEVTFRSREYYYNLHSVAQTQILEEGVPMV